MELVNEWESHQKKKERKNKGMTLPKKNIWLSVAKCNYFEEMGGKSNKNDDDNNDGSSSKESKSLEGSFH